MVARRRAHRQGIKLKKRRKTRLRVGSRWVGDVVAAGLTKKTAAGRRTRRCSASRAAPASRPTRMLPCSRGDRSGSTRSRASSSSGVSAVTRRPTLPSPPPLFPRSCAHRKGENPKRVGGMPIGDGLGRRVYALGRGGARAKEASVLQDWAPGRDWRRDRLPMAATALVASPAGAKGAFPLADSPGVGHGRERELGVHASLTAQLSHPRARGRNAGWSVRYGAVLGKRVEKKEVVRRPTRQREKVKERGRRLLGCLVWSACWVGWVSWADGLT
jgi:hypothetical protein